jgi:hypothetical protein
MLNVVMLNGANKPLMLSVIMLSVVMLTVVAHQQMFLSSELQPANIITNYFY